MFNFKVNKNFIYIDQSLLSKVYFCNSYALFCFCKQIANVKLTFSFPKPTSLDSYPISIPCDSLPRLFTFIDHPPKSCQVNASYYFVSSAINLKIILFLFFFSHSLSFPLHFASASEARITICSPGKPRSCFESGRSWIEFV